MNGEQAADMFKDHRNDLIVECPHCYSTKRRCKRPSGHAATQWHVSREDAYALRCGCTGCRNWLAMREEAGER